MTRKLTTLFAAATVLTGITAATAVFAEEGSPPATQPPHAQGMMGNHGGMMNMMGQMSPDQMKLMTSMMEKCNRMMDSASNAPARTDKEQTPATHG
jgi:hypothetical protein